MKKILCVAALAVVTMGLQGLSVAADTKGADAKAPQATSAAAGSCEDRAVDKNGKKLAGAAKASFLKKCEADAKPSCEARAVDKNGKKLAGAAKASFLKKCEAEAQPAH
jgi:predicted metal-binding protein